MKYFTYLSGVPFHLKCELCVILDPLCPTPPVHPFEGTRVFSPRVFEPVPEKSCAVEGETLYLKCPTFLTIFISEATLGRDVQNRQNLCNGQENRGPVQSCLHYVSQDIRLFIQFNEMITL